MLHMSYCIHNRYVTIINMTKGHFWKMIIHTDRKETEAQEINMITTAWPCLLCMFRGVGCLDGSSCTPDWQCAKLLEYTLPNIQGRIPAGGVGISRLFSVLMGRPVLKGTFVWVGDKAIKRLWYWLVLGAATSCIKAWEKEREARCQSNPGQEPGKARKAPVVTAKCLSQSPGVEGWHIHGQNCSVSIRMGTEGFCVRPPKCEMA